MSFNTVNTMNKTQLKNEAQDRIMRRIIDDLVIIHEDGTAPKVAEALEPHLRTQIRRIEKLFGYNAGSWGV
jgi:hypothetical protein